MQTLPPGTAVGPYTVESELARGGMGAVYRARRRGDGALVALKILDAGPAVTPVQQERFKREGELAARLAHPGIVRVLDAGSVSWLCYLAMDLIDGAPLGESAGRLTPLEAARLVAQVARAVEHAHAHGVVHRDLKPGNVLVRRHDGAALVTDFGIARDLGSSALTKTGALVGTPTYFSPEQAGGLPATAKSDVHALGAILYELLTGAPPFDRPDLPSLLVAITSEPARPPSALAPTVPGSLDRLCLAALAKSPDARPDAGAFADELEAIAGGRPEPRASSSRLVVASVALLALALAVGAALLASRPRPEQVVGAPAAVSSTTSVTAAPPPAPWVEPKWLRALRARGSSDTLLEAHAALDADPTIHERTRAGVLVALAELDARLKPPTLLDPNRADMLDQLLWLHWLWKRVDPAHALAPALSQAFAENDMWAFGSGPKKEKLYLMRVGRALVVLTPKNVMGYVFYATGSDDQPWTNRDGELLRVGAELAAAESNGFAWGALARDRGTWLDDVISHGTPEQSRDARTSLLVLARAGMTHGHLDPESGSSLLVRGASVAERDEAFAFLDHADVLTRGPTARSLQVRADRLAKDAVNDDQLAAAARTAEQGFDLVLAMPRVNPVWVAQSAVQALDLWKRAKETTSAVELLDKALRSAPTRQPGLALRRLLLALDLPTPPQLDAALADLVARLAAELEARKESDLDLADVETALDAASAAAGEASPDTVREHLGRWSDPAEVKKLDPLHPY